MNIINKIAVLGGDTRSKICAELFAKTGFECTLFGFEKDPSVRYAVRAASLDDALHGCDVLLLPLPVTKDGQTLFAPFSPILIPLKDLPEHMEKKALVLAGNPSDAVKELLLVHRPFVNYAQDEGFVRRNCVPTAEGALQLALQNTDATLFGSEVLVCGWGRVGSCLARRLQALGAAVTVSARKRRDLASIESEGMKAIRSDQIADYPTAFQVIFNTVPAPLLGEKVLKKLKGSPVLIELASKPYGAGFQSA